MSIDRRDTVLTIPPPREHANQLSGMLHNSQTGKASVRLPLQLGDGSVGLSIKARSIAFFYANPSK